MMSSQVFISGNSQAIRLPQEYQITETELFIQRVGTSLILFPKSNHWGNFEKSLSEFSADFMASGRNQPTAQKREAL